jgi:hypothetical protein
MQKVRVEKAKLRETLLANRETHVRDFEIAWDKYKERVIENVQTLLDAAKDARRGQAIQLNVNMQAPQNHADDYDRALEMLEWELDNEVSLEQHEFAELVQDDWGWKTQVLMSNKLYTGSASPSKAGLS